MKQANKLKESEGVLAMPGKRQGKKLAEDTKLAIEQFYEDDEFSRMCPGSKDWVSVRIDGEKVQKSK